MADRMAEYRSILCAAIDYGYRVHSVVSFHDTIGAGEMAVGEKYLVLRHDVDTDSETAARFWEIECDLGVRASYYFRLCTLHPELMKDIEASGGEASYHFEELATVAKERCLKTRDQAVAALPYIRDRFATNYQWLRTTIGLPMRTVASHGDFVNRRLGLTNAVILEDRDLRIRLGIELETYDDTMMGLVTSRHVDTMTAARWSKESPLVAIREGRPIVYILTHPRHFRVSIRANLSHDLRRLYEGLCFAAGIRTRHGAMRQALISAE